MFNNLPPPPFIYIFFIIQALRIRTTSSTVSHTPSEHPQISAGDSIDWLVLTEYQSTRPPVGNNMQLPHMATRERLSSSTYIRILKGKNTECLFSCNCNIYPKLGLCCTNDRASKTSNSCLVMLQNIVFFLHYVVCVGGMNGALWMNLIIYKEEWEGEGCQILVLYPNLFSFSSESGVGPADGGKKVKIKK